MNAEESSRREEICRTEVGVKILEAEVAILEVVEEILEAEAVILEVAVITAGDVETFPEVGFHSLAFLSLSFHLCHSTVKCKE